MFNHFVELALTVELVIVELVLTVELAIVELVLTVEFENVVLLYDGVLEVFTVAPVGVVKYYIHV